MNVVFLSLGANLGNREENFSKAELALEKYVGQIHLRSKPYYSAPVGFDSPHEFCNVCLKITTQLDPISLLDTIERIEADFGRKLHDKGTYVDRELDIDIIFYGQRIIEEPQLIIPHKAYEKRKFVVSPLLELANFQDPKTKRFIAEIKF